MRLYYPDTWKIVKVKTKDDIIYKVLGEFKGGYLDGDSWRMSSGVLRVEENDRAFEVVNHSGSVYVCVKGRETFGNLTSDIFKRYKEKAKNSDRYTLTSIKMDKLKKELDKKK